MAPGHTPPILKLAQRLVNFVHNPSRRPHLVVIALLGNWYIDAHFRKHVGIDCKWEWECKWSKGRDLEAEATWLADTIRAERENNIKYWGSSGINTSNELQRIERLEHRPEAFGAQQEEWAKQIKELESTRLSYEQQLRQVDAQLEALKAKLSPSPPKTSPDSPGACI